MFHGKSSNSVWRIGLAAPFTMYTHFDRASYFQVPIESVFYNPFFTSKWYKYRKSKLISIKREKILILSLIYSSFIFILLLMWFIQQKIHEESNLFYDNTAVRWWFSQYHNVMCVWNKLAIIIIITPHNHNIVLYTISHFIDHDHPQGYQKNDSVEKDIVYCHYQGVKISYFCFWMVWMILLQKVKLSFTIFRIYSK